MNYKRRLSFFFIVCAVFLLFLSPAAFTGQLEFHVINVGQGDSMFFKLPTGEVVLTDGGTVSAGERVVSYLKKSGVKKIDLLIATHPHEDHIGGLISVLDSFPVAKVWDSGYNLGTSTQRKFLERVKNRKPKFEVVREGITQKIGDVKIEVIAPASSQQRINDANSSSIITHVSWKNMSFLLMGDAEHKDNKMINRYPRSTVLKIAHHGSRNGTTKSLLRRVKPQIAVVSYGENNSYGHPHKEVLKLLKEFKVRLFSTVEGSIVIKTNGESYSVNHDKEEKGFIDMIESVLDVFFKW